VVGCATNSVRSAWTIAGLDALASDDERAAAADATLRLTRDAKSFGYGNEPLLLEYSTTVANRLRRRVEAAQLVCGRSAWRLCRSSSVDVGRPGWRWAGRAGRF
jgi:hypothetical protein